MTDIVERLRDGEPGSMWDAAREIKALRAGLASHKHLHEVLEKDFEALRAENDAYREECSNLKNELAKWVNYWRDNDNKALRAENARLLSRIEGCEKAYVRLDETERRLREALNGLSKAFVERLIVMGCFVADIHNDKDYRTARKALGESDE